MATQTARRLITRSLRDLGVLAIGETPTGAEAMDALDTLNELLESWSLERLMVYVITEVSKALTGGTASYTIGTGGSINTTRPLRIENAVVRDANNLDLPVQILTRDEFTRIGLKQTQSTYPCWLYYDNAWSAGLGTITLWPVPSASDKSLRLWLWQPLPSVASLETSINLPPGYTRALRSNLAVELAAEYGQELDAALLGVAIDSKAVIKSQLAEGAVQEMQLDSRLVGTHGRYWNYRTGEYL